MDIWEEMMSGKPYDALHPLLIEKLGATRAKIKEFNDLHPSDSCNMKRLLKEMLGSCGENIQINQPFRIDYGCNLFVGENFFANFNLTILDEAKVTIGKNAFIGPNCSIFTACHPLDPTERNKGVEWSEPVTIGDSVWIGGNATILPGVTIGNNVVIGAGSVVTRSFPDNVVIAGNPARIIKHIPETSSQDR